MPINVVRCFFKSNEKHGKRAFLYVLEPDMCNFGTSVILPFCI